MKFPIAPTCLQQTLWLIIFPPNAACANTAPETLYTYLCVYIKYTYTHNTAHLKVSHKKIWNNAHL